MYRCCLGSNKFSAFGIFAPGFQKIKNFIRRGLDSDCVYRKRSKELSCFCSSNESAVLFIEIKLGTLSLKRQTEQIVIDQRVWVQSDPPQEYLSCKVEEAERP